MSSIISIGGEGRERLAHGALHRRDFVAEPLRRGGRHRQHAFDQTLDRNGVGPLDPDGSGSGEPAIGEKAMMVARRPIALPAIAHGVESLEPWVAPVFGARCAADQNSSARGKGAVERRPGGLGIEPVDRAADTDNVECAELRGDVLEPALDEPHRDACALGRRARGLDHARLRIDAENLPAIRRKADRQDARPSADIEQALGLRRGRVVALRLRKTPRHRAAGRFRNRRRWRRSVPWRSRRRR